MGLFNPAGGKHVEHAPPITTRPDKVSIQGRQWSIWLALFLPGAPWMQSSYIQSPGITQILGQPRHQRLVCWPLDGPLPMQSLLCARHLGVPYLWIHRAVSTTLPGPIPLVEQTPSRSNRWACNHSLGAPTYQARPRDIPCKRKIVSCAPRYGNTNNNTPYPRMAPPTGGPSKGAICPPPGTKGGTKGGWYRWIGESQRNPNTYEDYQCPAHHECPKSNHEADLKADQMYTLPSDAK